MTKNNELEVKRFKREMRQLNDDTAKVLIDASHEQNTRLAAIIG